MAGFGTRRFGTAVQRATRPPAMPSQADIEKRVREARPGITLYQSGNDWKFFEYAGDTYWIPPDLTMGGTIEPPLIPHPAPPPEKRDLDGNWLVAGDGCLRIRDRYGPMWKEPTGGSAGKRQLVHDTMAVSAMDVMAYVIMNLQNRGIVILSGNPMEDAQYKAAAAAAELKAQLDLARSIVRTRKETILRWEKNPANKGLKYPPPMDFEQEAQEFLDQYEDEKMGSAGRYVCDCGAFQSDDFEKFRRHMRVAHNTHITQDQADADLRVPPVPVSDELIARGEPEETQEHIDREKVLRPISESAMARAKEQAERTQRRGTEKDPADLGKNLKEV